MCSVRLLEVDLVHAARQAHVADGRRYPRRAAARSSFELDACGRARRSARRRSRPSGSRRAAADPWRTPRSPGEQLEQRRRSPAASARASRFMTCSISQATSPRSISPTMRPLPFSVWKPRRIVVSASRSSGCLRHSGSVCSMVCQHLDRLLQEDLEKLRSTRPRGLASACGAGLRGSGEPRRRFGSGRPRQHASGARRRSATAGAPRCS